MGKFISTRMILFSCFIMVNFYVNAQKKGVNLLNPLYSSFENNYDGWFVTNKDNFIISDTKFNKGEHSLKFSLKKKTKPLFYKLHYTNNKSSDAKGKFFMKLKPGTYRVGLKLWVGNFKTSNAVKVALAGKEKGKYDSKLIKINDLKRREWVDVFTELEITEVGGYNFIFHVQASKKTGRQFESESFYLYVDDLSLVRL